MLLGGISTLSDRTFTSDAVFHPDNNCTLGVVPNKYHGWQMLRVCGFDVTQDLAKSFDVDSDCTIVYVHGTNLAADTYRPEWLTAGNGYTKQGETGTIKGYPEIYTDSGTIDVTSYFYEKSITAAASPSHEWDGYLANDYRYPFAHLAGCWLIPPGVTLSNIDPVYYELLSAVISDTYVEPDMDEYYWNSNPTSTPSASPTTLHTTLSAFVAGINGASAGEIHQLQDGTYTDQGLQTITGGAGTKGNLIHAQPETAGGVIFSGTTRFEFMPASAGAIDYQCWEMFKHTGNPYDGDNFDRCYTIGEWSRLGGENVPNLFFRNYYFNNIGSASYRSNIVRSRNGHGIVFSNTTIDGHTGDHSITDDGDRNVAGDGDTNHPRHLWMRDVDFDGKNAGAGDQGAFWEMGNGDFFQESRWKQAQLLFRCRLANHDHAKDTEFLSIKASNMRLVGNWCQNNDAAMSPRAPLYTGFVANVFTNSLGASGQLNSIRNMQGGDSAFSRNARSINFIQGAETTFSDTSGFITLPERDNTENGLQCSPRYDSYSGDLDYDSARTTFLTIQNESGTQPQDIFMEGLAADTSGSTYVEKGSVFGMDDITNLEAQGCVVNGGGAGPTISGITEADPGFSARNEVGSDIIYLPSHGSWSVSINIHPPYWLKGVLPTTIGHNWT